MKEFNILSDYAQLNISGERHVLFLIEEIKKKGLVNETEIILNLEGCQTDYPETPKFIDFFLSHLAKQTGKKKLTIKYNGLATKEIYVLYDIILEGDFFDIHEKIDSDADLNRWKEKINSKLKYLGITMIVINTADNEYFNYG